MYIHITVTAGAKKELFEKIGESQYKISVKEKAEKNRANTRVLQIIAGHFGVNPKKVRIINGHRSPSKLISIIDD